MTEEQLYFEQEQLRNQSEEISDRYKKERLMKSDWFMKAYFNMKIGDIIKIE